MSFKVLNICIITYSECLLCGANSVFKVIYHFIPVFLCRGFWLTKHAHTSSFCWVVNCSSKSKASISLTSVSILGRLSPFSILRIVILDTPVISLRRC
ncbi:hypothetical protein BSP15_048 [Bacillus phage BSP15]|nr:hypothetical protein BSP15_048 [Bacillus phage BSP15]